MAISFDKAFGLHPDALLIRDKRSQVLAENIANADTPGYKAKDMDFQTALAGAQSRQSGSLGRTDPKHFEISTARHSDSQYRIPNQPDTGDGNTVDIERERAAFAENTVKYEAALRAINGRISTLKQAMGSGNQ